jgi:hypothetical protein
MVVAAARSSLLALLNLVRVILRAKRPLSVVALSVPVVPLPVIE